MEIKRFKIWQKLVSVTDKSRIQSFNGRQKIPQQPISISIQIPHECTLYRVFQVSCQNF